jgi:nicotinamidase/pyrazinamidase
VNLMDISEINIVRDIKVNGNDALIIVDIQNDFLPGGALAVEKGDEIVEGVNKLALFFKTENARIVLTQDWHPRDHLSFASNHPGKKPGDEYRTGAIGPILWPNHCIQGTGGAKFHQSLKTEYAHGIVRKGYNKDIDSYSGFMENDKKSETGLAGYLKSLKTKRIFICGLALDYCCFATAMDGVDFGFKVLFINDLTRGIDLPPGNISNAFQSMNKKGIKFAELRSFF